MELPQNSKKGLFSKSSSNAAKLRISFLTLFPDLFPAILNSSLWARAQKQGLIQFEVINIRDFAQDKHKTVDDSPYGGGPGMLLRADVLRDAWKSIASEASLTVLLSPQGKKLDQKLAKSLSLEVSEKYTHLILVCGHYEGVDQRFIDLCVDREISIGDYILTGGELAALVLADAVTRLCEGVVGNQLSISQDSLEEGLLKYPQYTRPETLEGLSVPEVLRSGDHGKIESWRKTQAELVTLKKRPDLL